MSYITQDQLSAKVPAAALLEALDDDGDGAQDKGAWERLMEDTDRRIHGFLAQSYAVPFAAPVPDVIVDAATVYSAELVYQRRGKYGDQNPWTKRADAMDKRLQGIAESDEELPGATAVSGSGGTVIGEDSKVYDSNGQLMA